MADIPRSRALPANPNLEHLKNEAKERLSVLRAAAPDTQLSEAQFQIAREYGFSSWRALKQHVDEANGSFDVDTTSPLDSFTGYYTHKARVMENFLFTVTQESGNLRITPIVGPALTLTRGEDGWFQARGISTAYGFGDIENGKAQTLHVESDGRQRSLFRVDESRAQAIRAAFRAALADHERLRAPVPMAPEILARYRGFYVSFMGNVIEISLHDGRLYAQLGGQPRFEIFPESDTKFFYTIAPAQLSFEIKGDAVSAMVLHQNGLEQWFLPTNAESARRNDAAREARLAEQLRPRKLIEIDTSLLGDYVGRYRIGMDREMEITTDNGRLFGQVTNQQRWEIFPEATDKFFFTAIGAQVSFVRSDDGPVTLAVLHQQGREMPMPRIEDGEAAA